MILDKINIKSKIPVKYGFRFLDIFGMILALLIVALNEPN